MSHKPATWPLGDGRTASLIRARDWSKTPLGAIETWPPSLRNAVALVLAAPVAMDLLWGPELIQIYNEANQAFMGTKHPDAFGQPARETWAEIWDTAEALLHRPVFAGKAVTLVDHPWTIVRNGHPEEAFFTTYGIPVRDETGAVSGELAIAFETTESVKARIERSRGEAALRESEARLQAAIDLAKLGCYAWNPQTNELKWDDTLRAMWGLSADEPVDYDVWRAGVHPEDLARVEVAIQRCADPRGDGVYDIEYRVIGKSDGVERWIATRGQTQFQDDRPLYFYGVALDVTDRKRIESALERRVEARTRELEQVNRQLRSQIEQREIAESAVQQLQRLDAIGQITSGLAHDFNNLLTVVVINARLLASQVRDSDGQENIGLIRAAAERGMNITTRLLAFSRKQRLKPQTFDLNSKVAGMSDLLNVTLGGKVYLKLTLAPHLWPAVADPTQFEPVVLNLAINARDAMPSGGTLTIETFNAVIENEPQRPEEPSAGDYVGLVVTDTGVGIPDHLLPRVFEPFFTTKEPGKGAGLGLAQVFGFAKQSGGGVQIDTRVGGGTSVKVFLPRAEVDEHERESADT